MVSRVPLGVQVAQQAQSEADTEVGVLAVPVTPVTAARTAGVVASIEMGGYQMLDARTFGNMEQVAQVRTS